MQDYWNDPPEQYEPPEWYMILEEAMENDHMPESIKTAVQNAIASWVMDENNKWNVEPLP